MGHVTADAFVPFLQSGFPWHAPNIDRTHVKTADDWWAQLAPVLCYALQRVVDITEAQAKALLPKIL